jgi:glycosyltransferase involved in cell wall biosynthesis
MSISIITPSFNQSEFIERTINSVLVQNIPALEYLIIDGGSTDNSLERIKKYEGQLRWISEKDDGQAHAINKGIRLTSGAIIGWLNSDDIYYPNTLKTICDFFSSHPNVDIVYGDANHINDLDEIIEPYYTEAWNPERLKEVCFLSQPAVFFRRSIIDQFGLLNENLSYCMDYEYWLRLALNGARFYYLPHLLSGSRLHPAAKTCSRRVEVHAEINNMLKEILNQVPDRWLSNYAFAKAHAKQRASEKHLKRAIAIRILLASLRWNKWINKSLLKMSFSLFKNSLVTSSEKA